MNPQPSVSIMEPPAASNAPPPAKKRKSFSSGKSRGSGLPDRNQEGLVEIPKLSHSQMGLHQTQLSVSVDLSGLPACVNKVSDVLKSTLQNANDAEAFKFCHLVAVCYDVWLLVDRQAVNRYGFGPTIASREMVMLHDVTASFVEALSATVLDNGAKLSTSTDSIVALIKRIIRGAADQSLRQFFNVDLPADDFTLERFPLGDVLGRWEVLRAKVARYCGNLSSWRLPDCKADFSLLASGVHLVGEFGTSCGVKPLPQRLEKVCLAMRLIRYDRLGASSYVPQIIHEIDDSSSLASRCGCFSGLTMSRDQAVTELLVGMAPLSRV